MLFRFLRHAPHVSAGGAGRGIEGKGFKQRLFQLRIVGELDVHVDVAQLVVGDHFPGLVRMEDGVGNGDGVFYRCGERHVAAGGYDEVFCAVHAVNEVDGHLDVVELAAEQHDGRQRDIAADDDVVPVGDFLGSGQIHILVDGEGVRPGLAHQVNDVGRIAADKEGGKSPLFPDGIENGRIGVRNVLGEIDLGNLGNDGINGHDNVHPRIKVVLRHLEGDLRSVRHQFLDVLGLLLQIPEEFRSPEMGG